MKINQNPYLCCRDMNESMIFLQRDDWTLYIAKTLLPIWETVLPHDNSPHLLITTIQNFSERSDQNADDLFALLKVQSPVSLENQELNCRRSAVAAYDSVLYAARTALCAALYENSETYMYTSSTLDSMKTAILFHCDYTNAKASDFMDPIIDYGMKLLKLTSL